MSVFERIAKTVKEHPWWIITTAAVVTIILGFGLMFIRGQITYESLLPRGFPSIETLEELRSDFGGISYEHVLIESDSVTSPEMSEFLIGLNDSLMSDPRFNQGQIVTTSIGDEEKVPFVQSYLTPFAFNIRREMLARGFDIPLSSISSEMIEGFTGMNLPELIEQQYLSNPLVENQMVGSFITPDRTAALIIIKYDAELSQTQQAELGEDLEDFFSRKLSAMPNTEFYIAGDATLARDFETHIRNKTVLLFLIAIIFVILALFLAFRRFSDTVLPIAIMVLGLTWAFGFAGWVGLPYSVASIAIMPILLGTALTFVVPFMARYYEGVESHFRSVRAVGIALMTVGTGLFLAAVTNVFGFLVFEFSVLPPLRDFGLTCAVGTIFTFLLSIAVLPAIMVVRDRLYEKKVKDTGDWEAHFDGLSRRKRRGLFARATDRMLVSFSDLAIRHSGLVIIVFTVLILLGFSQIRGLTTDSDLRELVPKSLPGIEADYQIEKHFGGFQQDIILVQGDVLEPESLQAMYGLEDSLATDEDNYHQGEALYPRNRMMSLADALAYANNGRLPSTETEVQLALQAAEDNGGFIEGGLLGLDGESAIITLNAMGAETAEVIDRKMQLLNEYSERYLESEGLTYELGGITPLTKDMTKNIIPTETYSSILSLVLCALILVIIFRSFPYGLITLTVALAGVSAEIGLLSLLNWPLDIITSLASALVIGIGVNFGILFTHRFMYELKTSDKLPLESIRTTMMNLGRANVVAAIATIAAFLIIMLSDIVPLKRFGGVTAFAIGWCLVTSLTLMPALLNRLSGYHEEQEAVVVEPAPEVS